jgi:predicted nucleotidyltransferase
LLLFPFFAYLEDDDVLRLFRPRGSITNMFEMKPIFPTKVHEDAAEVVRDYFLKISGVDTVLVVNSCARGKATAESDLDFAILINPEITATDVKDIESTWQLYSNTQPVLLKYKTSNKFAHLHLDVVNGNYIPALIENGEPIDQFEIEIGNQICYSAPMDDGGSYFRDLQSKWLPYYNENLRLQRLETVRDACNYHLDHIPFFIKRELYFQSFHILCTAFQQYLQFLFIANKTYPIAYNKWIKEQIIKWLKMPDLYPRLSAILSVTNIESTEINRKAAMLRDLLNEVEIEY